MVYVLPDQVRAWASQLAGEARGIEWFEYSYVIPEIVEELAREFVETRGELIGLVGLQGVGKSSALMALAKGKPFQLGGSRVLFKWRSEKELFKSLANYTHEATDDFLAVYLRALVTEIQSRLPTMEGADNVRLAAFAERVNRHLNSEDGLDSSEMVWAESKLGRAVIKTIREEAWFKTLRFNSVILIDTPDYSRTDKRRMDRDLEEIYWFWNNLKSEGSLATIVVAIQKEMFRDHYFLDKMRMVELKPLSPEKMVEAYARQFDTIDPFLDDALLAVARMSGGVFRRFLRYILLTLDYWEKPGRSRFINLETVRKAVPTERLAEDMELEFMGCFPKHSELRMVGVRLKSYLLEKGPTKQSELVRELEVGPSAMSRLLTKLESTGHINRSREGLDKVVSLRE